MALKPGESNPAADNAPGFLTVNQAVDQLLAQETVDDDTSDQEHGSDDAEEIVEAADDDAPEPVEVEADEYADDLDDDELDEVDEDPTPRFTVNVGGEEQEVTLDELRKGYQRQADYSRKTQDLAQEREQLTQAEQEARANRDQYADKLQQAVEQGKAALETEPDWNALFEADPIEYVRQKEAWRDRKDAQAQAEAELAGIRAQQQLEQRQYFETRVAEQQHVLTHDLLPEWQDPEKAKAGQDQIKGYMKANGFSEQEMQIFDARIIKVLHDAAQWAALQASPPGKKKVPKAPKMTPSRKAQRRPTRRKRVEGLERQLQQTGDPRVAAQLLLERGK